MKATPNRYDWSLPQERALFVRWIVALALALQLLLTYPLWLTAGRSFPIVPVAPWVGALLSPADSLNFILLLAFVALIAVRPSALACIVVIAELVVLALQDLNRVQSWALYYLLMLAALAPSLRRSGHAWGAGRTIALLQGITLAALFWNGAQKAQPDFFSRVVPAVTDAWGLPLPALRDPVSALITILPALEVAGALALLFPVFRQVGVGVSVACSLATLLLCGPLGLSWQRPGWYWELALILITPRLFWRSDVRPGEILLPGGWWPKLVLWGACGLAPLLGFFGLSNLYLSFGLFSGRAGTASVVLEQRAYRELPKAVRKSAKSVGDQGFYRLQLQAWSESELGSPPSSSVVVLRSAAETLCPFINKSEPLLVGLEEMGSIPWIDSGTQTKLMCEGSTLVPYQPRAATSPPAP